MYQKKHGVQYRMHVHARMTAEEDLMVLRGWCISLIISE